MGREQQQQQIPVYTCTRGCCSVYNSHLRSVHRSESPHARPAKNLVANEDEDDFAVIGAYYYRGIFRVGFW